MKGYCDICHQQYGNIAQHRNTKKHKETAAKYDQNKQGDIDGAGSIPPAEGTGRTKQDIEESRDMQEMHNQKAMSQDNKIIGSIQIIDGNTRKKNIFEELYEFAMKPEMQPITMMIVQAVGQKLNGTGNTEQEEGKYIRTLSGNLIPKLDNGF